MKQTDLLFVLDLQLFADDPEPKKEEKQVVEETKKADPDKNTMEALKKLKENSVSKEEYDRVVERNRELLESYINGKTDKTEVVDDPKDKPTADSLRKELYGGERDSMTNLEYWEKTLELRKIEMDKGKTDPFVPVGSKVQPTYEDFVRGQRIAEVMEECIKVADGDPIAFNNELRRRGLD
jgi:hypothetical protein